MRWTTNYTAGGTCIIACTGTRGTAANQLRDARDIKFDRYGNIYVTDQSNNRIQKFLIQLSNSSCPSSKKTLLLYIKSFLVHFTTTKKKLS